MIHEQKAVLLVVGLAFLAGASSSSAAAGHLRSTALANQPGSMRLRGGMATMAEQMAEIRAKKAQQYAAVKDEHSSDVLASETKDSSGAQADWMLAQDKVGPESISTKGHSMEIGDARNIYLGQGVTVLRNKRTGMAVEFLHESKGWFYLRPRDGAGPKQISTEGIVFDVHRFYASGVLEQLKNNPLRGNRMKDEPVKAGCWKLVVDGPYIVVSNMEHPTLQIYLCADSVVTINSATNEAVWMDSSAVPRHLTADAAREELN